MTCGQTHFIALPRLGDDSQTSRLADELAMAIHLGEIAPGLPLREVELAKSNGVSRTIVRAALQRLEAQGLAEIVINKGARVSRPDSDATRDMVELHARLTVLAAQTAASRASEKSIDYMAAFVAGMEHVSTETGEAREFQRLRVGFVRALFQAAGSVLAGRLAAAAPVVPHHCRAREDIATAEGRREAAMLARDVLMAVETRSPDAASRAAEAMVRRHAEQALLA